MNVGLISYLNSINVDFSKFNLSDYDNKELAIGDIINYYSLDNYSDTKYICVELISKDGKFYVKPSDRNNLSPIVGICLDDKMESGKLVRIIKNGITKARCNITDFNNYESTTFFTNHPQLTPKINIIKANSTLTITQKGITTDLGLGFVSSMNPQNYNENLFNAYLLVWGYRMYLCVVNRDYAKWLIGTDTTIDLNQSTINFIVFIRQLYITYFHYGISANFPRYNNLYLTNIMKNIENDVKKYLSTQSKDYILSFSDINNVFNNNQLWNSALEVYSNGDNLGVVLTDTNLSNNDCVAVILTIK